VRNAECGGRRAEQNRKRSVLCEVRGLSPEATNSEPGVAHGYNPRTSHKTLRLRFCTTRQRLHRAQEIDQDVRLEVGPMIRLPYADRAFEVILSAWHG